MISVKMTVESLCCIKDLNNERMFCFYRLLKGYRLRQLVIRSTHHLKATITVVTKISTISVMVWVSVTPYWTVR